MRAGDVLPGQTVLCGGAGSLVLSTRHHRGRLVERPLRRTARRDETPDQALVSLTFFHPNRDGVVLWVLDPDAAVALAPLEPSR